MFSINIVSIAHADYISLNMNKYSFVFANFRRQKFSLLNKCASKISKNDSQKLKLQQQQLLHYKILFE